MFLENDKVPSTQVLTFIGDRTLREVDPYSGDSTQDIFLRGSDLYFNTGNYLHCTCIRHASIIRHCLSGINNISKRNPYSTPWEIVWSLNGSI